MAKRVRDKQDKAAMLRRALERIIQLYTDKAHFIYELLQNAEDVQATVVRFHLMDDCLEVYHDGIPFTEENLKSLCDIGASDKANNLNQIGEFGVGFKSVFGICERVRLYSIPRSGNNTYEAFAVEIIDFNESLDISSEPIPEPYTTKFVFPYCVGESFSGFKTIDALKNTIAERLKNLGVTTLLFMRHISSIEYEIDCEGFAGSGCYMLDEKKINSLCSIVSAMGSTNGDEEELSYLKYSKTINSSMINSDRTVDIAYPVVIEKDGRYRFEKAKKANISVYFPTETESKIPLIVQGPYRTTPNRSSVPFDNEENISLAQTTADLLYESVLDIKAQGLMSLQLLNILPLQEPENIDNWLFKPLYDKMIELFQTQAILPTAEGGYVTGKQAKIVRGQELISILPSNLLGELINNNYATDDDEKDDTDAEEICLSYIPYKWLPVQLTKDNKELSVLYSFLTDELDIEVIRPEDLRFYLGYNENFLKNRDDLWLEQFYKYLERNSNLVNRSNAGRNILSIPFVKTADDIFVVPFCRDNKIANVFMPTKNIVEGFQFVHTFLAEQCNSFFTGVLGLKEPDPYVLFKKEIQERYAAELSRATDEEHIEDINSIIKFMATKECIGDLMRTLSSLYYIQCEGKVYANPNCTAVYFDKSNESVSIKDYFVSDDNVRFVNMGFYAENGVNRQILQLLGIKDTLIEDWDIDTWYYGEGNTMWRDDDPFRSHLDFVGIDNAIRFIENNPESNHAKEKSKIIMKLLLYTEKHLSGEIIKGKTARKRESAKARIIETLIYGRKYYRSKPKWLFDQSGRVVNPTEITKYDLDTKIYGEYKRDSNIYDILGMQIDENKETQEKLACMVEQNSQAEELIVDQFLIKYLGMQLSEVIEKLAFMEKYKPLEFGNDNMNNAQQEYFDPDTEDWDYEFPSRPVRNLEKLRQSVEGQYLSAPRIEREMRYRRIRTSETNEIIAKNRSYLKNMYSCEDNRMLFICQMCKNPAAYFEVVQIEKEPKLELWQMHLLLCLDCAAYYKGLRNDALLNADFISNLCDADEKQDEPVCVSIGSNTINFTATHIAEIKEIQRLNVLSKADDETSITDNEVM